MYLVLVLCYAKWWHVAPVGVILWDGVCYEVLVLRCLGDSTDPVCCVASLSQQVRWGDLWVSWSMKLHSVGDGLVLCETALTQSPAPPMITAQYWLYPWCTRLEPGVCWKSRKSIDSLKTSRIHSVLVAFKTKIAVYLLQLDTDTE